MPSYSEANIPDKGEEFTEDTLYERFGTQTMGGIRYTLKHNRVILLDSVFSNYDDRVDEKSKTVTYIGTGEGDQSFESAKGERKNGAAFNRKITDPNSVLLYFQKPSPNRIIFKYKLKYISHHYDNEKNKKGKLRKVIKFKLKII